MSPKSRSSASNLAAAMMGGGAAKKLAAKPAAKSAAAKPAAVKSAPQPAAAKPVPVKSAPQPAAANPVAVKRAPSGEGLDGVRAAIDAGDGAAALTAALAWWRATRADAVADLVDAISARVSPAGPTDATAWGQRASRQDPVALGGLLAVATALPASYLPTAAAQLAAYPLDPRITGALATWVAEPPTSSSSTYPFWTRMFAIAAATGDRRAIAAFAKRRRRAPGAKSQFWPKFYAALAKAEKQIAAATPAPADLDAGTIAAIGKLATAAAALGPVEAVAPTAATTPAVPTAELLPAALAALQADRLLDAIDALVAHWRTSRSPAVADLVEHLSLLLPANDLLLGSDPKGDAAVWATLLAEPRANLPRLLANLTTGDTKAAELRLVDLANLDDDPRTALALVELCAMANISPERTQFWRALLELVARLRDPRTVAPLRAIFYDFERKYYDHHRQAKRIVGPWCANPAPPAILGKAERDALAALGKLADRALAADRHRALIAAIAEAADDDPGPRLVYADWLTERGHPRGELLLLAERARARTATDAEQARLFELYKAGDLHGWLDGFADRPFFPFRDRARALPLLAAAYPAGLPTRLEVSQYSETLWWRRAAREPLIALVRELAVDHLLWPPEPEAVGAVVAAAPALARIAFGNVEPAYLQAVQPVLRAAGFVRDGATFARR